MRKVGGLRKRWLTNTVSIIFALGMVCVLAVTATFAAYYYSNMEADMQFRAETTTDFFEDYIDLDYKEFYQSCMTYAQTFEDRNDLELQFINKQGRLVASSYGNWAGDAPRTPEIEEAVSTRSIRPFLGKDPDTGERIMAVSSPMIYSNGEVIGVLRYVTSTRLVDRQIIFVGLICFCVLLAVVGVVIVSSNYFIRTVMTPVEQITENPYLQYFIGLPGYQEEPPFDASTLVLFRKRINAQMIAEANEYLLSNQNKKDDFYINEAFVNQHEN